MDQLQVLYLLTVGKIAGEAYTVKAFRQDMLQEHHDKVAALHSQVFFFASVGIVFVSDGDMCIGDLFDPAVRDRRQERIPCQVADGVTPAVEGLTDERKPVLCEQSVNELLPLALDVVFQFSCTGKIHRAIGVHLLESAQIFSAEHGGHDISGQEEARVFCFYELLGGGESASGYTDVDVRVEGKLLSPSVENGNDPGFRGRGTTYPHTGKGAPPVHT